MKRLNNKVLVFLILCSTIACAAAADSRRAPGGCYVSMCSPEEKRMDEILAKGRDYIVRLEAQRPRQRVELSTWSPEKEPNCNWAFHQKHFVACNLNDARARALSQHLGPRIDMIQ